MNTFISAVKNQGTTTTNDMPARMSSANPLVDFFYQAGAMRGQDIIPLFVAAYAYSQELALRLVLWLRDVREGAGERELFRQVVKYLSDAHKADAVRLLDRVPLLGRWDDLLCVDDPVLKNHNYYMIGKALLYNSDGLCAKWMPRQGKQANELAAYLGYTPRNWRKLLVRLTKVVETQMCAGQWDDINFSHVPSLASARYKKAFNRHTPKYQEYVKALVKGEPGVKVNTGAVYPYDVLKGFVYVPSYSEVTWDETERNHVIAQWNALPNMVGSAKILPLVDVSGSMHTSQNPTPLEVAVSLGLYMASKNTGAFKDMFLTFSGEPEMLHLEGDILQKIDQMVRSTWGMNTNIQAAFSRILEVAIEGDVPQEEMPEILIIFSDMQFDRCVGGYNDTALRTLQRQYTAAGYQVPTIVFWNLNSHSNVPVKFDERGTAMVSGFSPSLVKAILGGDLSEMSPEAIMMQTIMKERYSV